MRAGLLRHPVEILENIESRDASGAVYSDWQVIDTDWMDFDPQFGSEQNNQGRQIDPQAARFRVRFREDIHSKLRLRFDGDDYEITGKPQLRSGRKKEILIPVQLVTDG